MHSDKPTRIIHATPIPQDGYRQAVEYTIPVRDLPREADGAWRTWLEPLLGLDADGVHQSIRRRFERVGTQFVDLRDRVLRYLPFSILVYGGTPLLWLRRLHVGAHDVIYLPPESDRGEVRKQLEPYQLVAPDVAADILANFGGMGERWPWEEIEFAGRKEKGHTVISEANVSFLAGSEYWTEAEKRKRLANFKRWLGGITILGGGDGLGWHLGRDGSVCEYEVGYDEIWGMYDTLPAMIAAFLPKRSDTPLFARDYSSIRMNEADDSASLNG